MIQETIDEINGLLLNSFTDAQKLKDIQVCGVAMPMYDQQVKAERLFLPLDGQKRLVLNNKSFWQSAHLVEGGNPTTSDQWGSFRTHQYELYMLMIGCSKKASGLAQALGVLENTSKIRIERFETNTLDVLNRYWKQPSNDEKNYDPSWWAFAIQYRILGVSGTEFGDFYNLLDEVTL